PPARAHRARRHRCSPSRPSERSACDLHHNSPVRRDTLVDFFTDLASAHGTFLVHDDGFRPRTWRYSDVARAARGFCARLYGAGLTKGDKVVFFSENRPEWIAALWGCLLGGLVVVPIDYRASPEFLARVARIVKARLILVGQDVPPLHMPAGPATDTAVWRLHDL